jgi:predicted RNA methylase
MPLSNEFNQFALDLFGNTSLSSDALAPSGLIRIPMKEDVGATDVNAALQVKDQIPLGLAVQADRSGKNFRLDGHRHLAAGWKHRAKDNIAAIRTLQAIEAAGRAATEEEQEILIKFCAFSSTELAQNIFGRGSEPPKQSWSALAVELEALVSAEEKAGLMRATQYAHYTPEFIIRAMWSAVVALGFEGGNVLEPGCGTGLFMAASPTPVAEKSFFSGIEADLITARIATLLYPESDIRLEDFTKAKLAGDYDLAIGNPPFSDRTQRFTGVTPAVALSLHDFFVAKSVYHLRPGGLAAFVVSRWTMDKCDPTARALIAKLADLVGAVRLPARAMRQDVLFFRRRMGDEQGNGVSWIETGEAVAATDDHGAFQINRYFLDRPEMVLGEHTRTTSPFGLVYACEGPTGEALEAGLRVALDSLPKGIYKPRPDCFRRPCDQPMKFFTGSVADGASIREGSYLVTNHRLHQVIDGVPTEIAVKRPRSKVEGVPLRSAEIIEGL